MRKLGQNNSSVKNFEFYFPLAITFLKFKRTIWINKEKWTLFLSFSGVKDNLAVRSIS